MNRLSQVLVLGAFCLTGSTAIAAPYYFNDFSANANGFSGTNTALTTSPSGQQFLTFGGGQNSGTLTLTGLPTHTSVQLSFDLYVVGSMDGGPPPANGSIPGGGNGDYFTVTYAGTTSGTAFNDTFANYGGGETQTYPNAGSAPGTDAVTINALGYSGFPATADIQDAEYHIDLTAITDAAGTFSFTFADNSNEGAGNEFYGIDNVGVTLDTPAAPPGPAGVPEPSILAMLGIGLVGLAAKRRKHA